MQKQIVEKANAKINLSLDVLGKRSDGYHEVSMVMQQVDLCDELQLFFDEMKLAELEKALGNEPKLIEGIGIVLTCSREDLACDETNLAYRAAKIFLETAKRESCELPTGLLKIHIEKRIPMAAGLAGGSSDAAAVLRGLNTLFNCDMSLAMLCELGAGLGSDVPFCVAGPCALATGTGTELKPCLGLDEYVVLSKPDVAVSTPEIYKAFDEYLVRMQSGESKMKITHPNQFELIAEIAMKRNKDSMPAFMFMPPDKPHEDGVKKNLINLLEAPASEKYPVIAETKEIMLKFTERAAMSGSGPTVFGIFENKAEAEKAYEALKEKNAETFISHSIK